ncbi:jg15665 [Pararge aegeria aegeria]|uniref:Jg15665 protein n=1 Tax=Pararge aegeria aegeria TaxID=348720 RepID=A0A8S4RUG1_9NEOP|nr:jg15665 [Pararge aegeria aegeria]
MRLEAEERRLIPAEPENCPSMRLAEEWKLIPLGPEDRLNMRGSDLRNPGTLQTGGGVKRLVSGSGCSSYAFILLFLRTFGHWKRLPIVYSIFLALVGVS